jgi:2-methylcitrate dehydratase PrpD
MNVTEMLVEQVRAIDARSLPADVIEAARHSLLDWTGIAIAGANEPLVGKLREEAREQGGHPLSTIVLHGERTSPAYAALINGSAADALDFSDANMAMRGHTTPAVVAAALAVGEMHDISGLELLTAIVAGVEMECRVGTLVNFPYLRKGFHPTGNIAPFGATAAAAYLIGLNGKQWAHALGTAATQAAGLHTSGGTMSKPFHSGKAAANGLLSANLAKRDWIARENAIEADGGFIETHATGAHVDELRDSAGRFFILDTIFKSHAACQLTHSTIENMLEFKDVRRLSIADIESIDIEVPRFFLSICNIAEPVTGLEAKFSLRAVAAMALLGDDTRDIGAYTAERLKRNAFIQLQKRIRVTPSDELGGGVATARVRLADGTALSATNDCYRPLHDLPRQRDMLVTKFRSLVSHVLGESRTEVLLAQILEADRLASVRQLVPLMVK